MVAVCSAPLSSWHLLVGCPPSNLMLVQRDSVAEDAIPTALCSRAQAAATRGGPAPALGGSLWDPAQWPGLDTDASTLQPLASLRGMACNGVPCAMLQGPLGLAPPPQLRQQSRQVQAARTHQLAAWPRVVAVTTGGQVVTLACTREQDAALVHGVVAASGELWEEGGAVLCHAAMLDKAARNDASVDALQHLRVLMRDLARSDNV